LIEHVKFWVPRCQNFQYVVFLQVVGVGLPNLWRDEVLKLGGNGWNDGWRRSMRGGGEGRHLGDNSSIAMSEVGQRRRGFGMQVAQKRGG